MKDKKMKRVYMYQLGVGLVAISALVSPVIASATTASTNTTVNATVSSVITISSSGTVAVNLAPTTVAVVSSASDAISVSTNNSTGYNLSLADSDATTSLVSGANNITAHTGTPATPTALATNTWGYAVAGGTFSPTYTTETNNASSTTKWAGVPATGSPVVLKTTATTATSDSTTVWYGVKVNASQPTGVYSDTVTYTAITN